MYLTAPVIVGTDANKQTRSRVSSVRSRQRACHSPPHFCFSAPCRLYIFHVWENQSPSRRSVVLFCIGFFESFVFDPLTFRDTIDRPMVVASCTIYLQSAPPWTRKVHKRGSRQTVKSVDTRLLKRCAYCSRSEC